MTEHPLATTDAPRSQVQTWLMEEGWSIREQPAPDMQWALVGQDPQGRHIVVGQKTDRPDQIILNGKVSLGPEHIQAMSELSPAELSDIRFQLGTALLHMGLEFGFENDLISSVMIGERIYEDALTKDEFLQRVTRVRGGVTMVLVHVQHRFHQLAPQQEDMGFRTD